jgi:hypothetical protein
VAPPERSGGPPPAWIETQAGNQWLGYSTFCWTRHTGKGETGICADAITPTCDQSQVPHVFVEEGETVRAHLGFTPTEASLLGGPSLVGGTSALNGRTMEWKIGEAGGFSSCSRGARVATTRVTPDAPFSARHLPDRSTPPRLFLSWVG